MTLSSLLLFPDALAQGSIGGRIAPPTDSSGLPSLPPGMTSAEAVKRTIASVLNVGFGFVATIAVAGVMWGGFLIITGGEEGFKKGRVAITYAVGGLALTIMAYTIVNLVLGLDPLNPELFKLG